MTASYAKHNGSRNEVMNDFFTGQTINTKYKTFGKEKGLELVLNSSADSFLKWIVGLNYYYADDWQDGLAYDNATGDLIMIPDPAIIYRFSCKLTSFTGLISKLQVYRRRGNGQGGLR